MDWYARDTYRRRGVVWGGGADILNEKISFYALNKFYITEPNTRKFDNCDFF
jgi:hypothetical protein